MAEAKNDYFAGRLENPHTNANYNRELRKFFEWCGGERVPTQELAERYIDHLRERGYAPRTLRVAASALKKYAAMHGVSLLITNIPKVQMSMPKVLSEDEIKRLIEGIPYVEDKAMVALLYDCGLRVSELVNLDVDDVDLESRTITVRSRKGGTPQVLPFGKKTKGFLEKWLEIRESEGLTKEKVPALFIGRVGRFGKATRITVQTVARRLKHYGRVILGRDDVHPHLIRHSRAVHLRSRGVPLEDIKDFLGHASLQTTFIYARMEPGRLKSIPML